MVSHLDRLVQLETDIAYQVPPDPGGLEFRYDPGSIPVLLSAPHGAVHWRNGQSKDEDEFTAGFCRLIAEVTGAHVLYAYRRSGTDPNYYPDVPYKQTLKQVIESAGIRMVLDIHGASSRHPFGLALGTMDGESCPDQRPVILHTLERAGFSHDSAGLDRLDVDHAFKGAGGKNIETVTRFAWRKLGIPAAQFELNAHLRIVRRKTDASQHEPFTGDANKIGKTVSVFIELVRALSI